LNTERAFDNAVCRRGCRFNVSELNEAIGSCSSGALLSLLLEARVSSRPAQKGHLWLTLTTSFAREAGGVGLGILPGLSFKPETAMASRWVASSFLEAVALLLRPDPRHPPVSAACCFVLNAVRAAVSNGELFRCSRKRLYRPTHRESVCSPAFPSFRSPDCCERRNERLACGQVTCCEYPFKARRSGDLPRLFAAVGQEPKHLAIGAFGDPPGEGAARKDLRL